MCCAAQPNLTTPAIDPIPCEKSAGLSVAGSIPAASNAANAAGG